jgi:hypothetical protein
MLRCLMALTKLSSSFPDALQPPVANGIHLWCWRGHPWPRVVQRLSLLHRLLSLDLDALLRPSRCAHIAVVGQGSA